MILSNALYGHIKILSFCSILSYGDTSVDLITHFPPPLYSLSVCLSLSPLLSLSLSPIDILLLTVVHCSIFYSIFSAV